MFRFTNLDKGKILSYLEDFWDWELKDRRTLKM